MNFRLPLHVQISSVILVLILLVATLIGGLGFKLSREMLESAADDLTGRIRQETVDELSALMAPAELATNLLARDPVVQGRTLAERMRRLPALAEAMAGSATISSVYVGYDSGDFFFVRKVRNDEERTLFKAPEKTTYIVQSIEHGAPAGRQGWYVFYDDVLTEIRRDPRPDYPTAYDPRSRGWYKLALESGAQIKTDPYLFFSSRKVGMTLSRRASDTNAVTGADILLETLSSSLARRKATPGTQLALVDRQGQIIALDNVSQLFDVAAGDGKPTLRRLEALESPVMRQLAGALKQAGDGAAHNAGLQTDEGAWHTSIVPVVLDGAQPLYLVTAIPDRELLATALKLRRDSIWITLAVILAAIPIIWWVAHLVSRPLRALVQEAEAIRRFDFRHDVKARTIIREVDDLAVTMAGMKTTIRRFLDISQAVAAESDFDKLQQKLLDEMLRASGSAAGLLYLADENTLTPAAAKAADGRALAVELPALAIDQTTGLLGVSLRDGKPHSGKIKESDAAPLGITDLCRSLGVINCIAVPLLNRNRELAGALLLLREQEADPALLSFVEALSGSTSVSLETRELIRAQKALFESFIRLIAGAIDAKSPYTGGHCARVPELTKMLARAAVADAQGPFKDFSLKDDDWEAIHVASWLHDCGKVTTPEYVVDKATKLETLYDRIHEVRMRFEVLKRDAEIRCLKAIQAGADQAASEAALATELAALDADYAFIAQCNEGGEFMAPDKVERLKAIAGRTWLRTLDDRVGISNEERQRKERVSAPPLPVEEPLLADKPEHVFHRRPQDCMPEDNPWGFRMAVPELMYNKGEVYNLGVSRGTLSEEERYKINEHIVQTGIMLSQLPFPRHLRQVPEIASGHHEKMDGSGYPKRLKREEMSPVARMMAIADIFEALTAVDRPYKKGKTLSEAIKIMSMMKRDHHVDPDLFELFLTSGVYREYGERFMQPDQIDQVDISLYLGQQAA